MLWTLGATTLPQNRLKMEWRPITLESLTKHIELLEYLFSEEQKSFWNLIKVKPEKWTEATMGDEGGGFWVVAIFGHRALYYNDIEEGFNISTYHKYGVIDEYYAGQSELHEIIGSLFDEIKRGVLNF